MPPSAIDSIAALRELRAELEQAEGALADREDTARAQGDRTTLDEVARERDELSLRWDDLAARHDAWARERDMHALVRDKRSSDRDVAARNHDSDRDRGFADRWHSAVDRDESAGDRADSFDDRGDAGGARDRARANRERSARDRGDATTSAKQQDDTIAHLERAAASRTVIGQAMGLLMAQRALSSDDAFTELVRLSQASNVKLRDVAAALVQNAQPPSAPSR